VFPVHCCHSSLPGRYASAAYTPVCGGTTDNMPRIPGGGSWNVAICCGPASSLFVGSVFRYGSPCFASGRPAGRLALSRDGTVWHGMTRRECAAMRRFRGSKPISPGPARRYSSVECVGMRRFASPSPMARPGRVARYGAPVAQCRAMSRAGDLRRSRPPLQWNGCRVCCVAFTLFPLPGAFFCRFGPVSSCRCPNTRRLGLC